MVYEPRVGAMESVYISKKVLNYISKLHFIGTLHKTIFISVGKRVHITVKPVLSDHLKQDKTMVLMEKSSLMKVESVAECSPLEHSAILLTCIKR